MIEYWYKLEFSKDTDCKMSNDDINNELIKLLATTSSLLVHTGTKLI